MTENEISKVVVDAALKVHRALGPGLLESVYEVVLAHELRSRGLHVQRQLSVPLRYENVHFDEGFRADLVVEGKVIVEIESVEVTQRVHKKQVLTYLRLADLRLWPSRQLRSGAHPRRHHTPRQRPGRIGASTTRPFAGFAPLRETRLRRVHALALYRSPTGPSANAGRAQGSHLAHRGFAAVGLRYESPLSGRTLVARTS